jgi:nudix-type nucleoside diphosphatase (YffH/AdpP family)
VSISNRIRIIDTTILSEDWSVLKKTSLSWKRRDGNWQTFTRETYDRGHGAVLLPYNLSRRTVLLTRQFRFPPYTTGHHELLIEAPAGLLDSVDPERRVREEVEEETGYRLNKVRKIFEMFMSPGSVTEKLHFFLGEYDSSMRIGSGGGCEAEGEDIEVLEVPFDEAMQMVTNGKILDGKTSLLILYAQLHVFSPATP